MTNVMIVVKKNQGLKVRPDIKQPNNKNQVKPAFLFSPRYRPDR